MTDNLVPNGQQIGFAEDIAAFQISDREVPPRPGRILFVGSSIVREWTHLAQQLAPLPILNRGFGGARTWEVLHYADAIVLPYRPRIIVYYGGSNDINDGETPSAIGERYRRFSEKVAIHLPRTIVCFLAIFRAPQKQDRLAIVEETNCLVQAYSKQTENRFFLDANPVVFDEQGQPRIALYREDGLHFTDAAYEELAVFIKPTLQDAWLQQTIGT